MLHGVVASWRVRIVACFRESMKAGRTVWIGFWMIGTGSTSTCAARAQNPQKTFHGPIQSLTVKRNGETGANPEATMMRRAKRSKRIMKTWVDEKWTSQLKVELKSLR